VLWLLTDWFSDFLLFSLSPPRLTFVYFVYCSCHTLFWSKDERTIIVLYENYSLVIQYTQHNHVYQLSFVQLNFQSRHLGFLTSAYLLAAYCHCYKTSGVFACEYSGVAVRICLLASVEQKIYHACVHIFHCFFYNFRFWAAILANWWVANMFWPYYLVARPYLGKVTKAFPLTPSGYEMAAERMAWG